MFFGTASSFIERVSFSEIEAKQEAILFFFGCSEVNSTWIITSGLANQRAPKALFTCVVYTNYDYKVLQVDPMVKTLFASLNPFTPKSDTYIKGALSCWINLLFLDQNWVTI